MIQIIQESYSNSQQKITFKYATQLFSLKRNSKSSYTFPPLKLKGVTLNSQVSKDTAVAHHKKVYLKFIFKLKNSYTFCIVYIQICFSEKDLNDYNFFLIAGKFNLIFTLDFAIQVYINIKGQKYLDILLNRKFYRQLNVRKPSKKRKKNVKQVFIVSKESPY